MTPYTFYFSFYGVLLFFTLLFAVKPNILKHEKNFFIVWFCVIVSFSLFLRFYFLPYLFDTFFDTIKYSDIYGYYALSKGISYSGIINKIQFGFSNSSLLYYTREPVLWGLLKYLYLIFNDERIVFFIIDCLGFSVIFYSFKQLENNSEYNVKSKIFNLKYLYFGIFLTMPFVFGISSIYRQYLSMILLFAAFAFYYSEKNKKSLIFYILAVLSHNSAILFFPLYFILKKSYFNFLALASYIVLLPIVLPILPTGTSRPEIEVGSLIGFYYVLILFFTLSICIFLSKDTNDRNRLLINNFLTINLFLLILCSFLISSNLTERIALYILTISTPILAVVNERFVKNKIFGRLTIIIFILTITVYYDPFY